MGRARWIGMMIRGRDQRSLAAAMSWESMTDEIDFIIGPILVAVRTTLINPAAPFVIAAAIVFIFAISFALHPTHAHAPRRTAATARERLLTPQPALIVAAMTVIGMFWGVSLTTLTELSAHVGDTGLTGYIYGAGLTQPLAVESRP